MYGAALRYWRKEGKKQETEQEHVNEGSWSHVGKLKYYKFSSFSPALYNDDATHMWDRKLPFFFSGN